LPFLLKLCDPERGRFRLVPELIRLFEACYAGTSALCFGFMFQPVNFAQQFGLLELKLGFCEVRFSFAKYCCPLGCVVPDLGSLLFKLVRQFVYFAWASRRLSISWVQSNSTRMSPSLTRVPWEQGW
jgi:hypothetical protein